MSDRDVLPFPSPDSDDPLDAAQMERIGGRISALYATTPTPDALQIDRCTRTVLTQVMHQRSRSILGVPRTRWWWGAAAAAVFITATLRPWRGTITTRDADKAFVQASAAVKTGAPLQGSVTSLGGDGVRFDLRLPANAKQVAIVGDFNGWNQSATPMAARRDGTWSANIPLAPGRHVYAFVIDGKRWVVDPLAPQVPDDGYGPANAVVIDATPKE